MAYAAALTPSQAYHEFQGLSCVTLATCVSMIPDVRLQTRVTSAATVFAMAT
jgi:hypothetical protein